MKTKNFKKNKLLLVVIVVLGALVRLLYLGSVPGGLHQDEAIVAWNAYSLLNDGYDSAGHIWPVYVADWGDGHSLLYCILAIPFLLMNGNHLSHVATRMPQAIVGILTIVAIYGVLKKMFDETHAMWGAFLLTICPWHITMCRWGLDANLAPGFLIFGLYFFLKGMDNEKYLLVSAVMYGLALHCYAVIWPLVFMLMLLQISYGLYHKKLYINRWSLGATFIMFLLALPCILFLLVNGGVLEEIYLPFMSVPAMSGYRVEEIAITVPALIHNAKRVLSLLIRQDTGAIYDIIMPSGLFYDLGRVFIVIGFFAVMIDVIRKVLRKEWGYEFFLFVQLCGAGIIALLVEVDLHQTNCLFIPLVMCEAIGVVKSIRFVAAKIPYAKITFGATVGLLVAFLLLFGQFEFLYFTEYRTLVSSYFAEGLSECIPHAFSAAKEYSLQTGENVTIAARRGVQWPRLLYYTDTYGEEYLENIVYKEDNIEPYSFTSDGITFINDLDLIGVSIYDFEPTPNTIYIFYWDNIYLFENEFVTTQYNDWYVAIPKEWQYLLETL